MDVSTAQVVGFRLASHGLARGGFAAPESALATWTVQDSPPGAAAAALANRLSVAGEELAPGWVETAIAERRAALLYNARTATALLPVSEAAVYATAQLPEDDADFKALVRTSVPEQESGYAEPVALAVDAISDALDGRALSRDDLHEELRQRLPDALLPWCEGCRSHHAKRGMLVMASLRGRLCISGRAGRQPEFSRTDQWAGWSPPAAPDARRQLLERYLHAYGPSKSGEFAEWAGLSKPLAKRIWVAAADAGMLLDVTVDGAGAGAILTADADQLADPPPAEGVLLLGPGDPLLVGRDRERLVADAAVRKRLWSALPTTGLVLADGAPAATWKAKKSGKRLDVTVAPIGSLSRAVQRAIESEAERLAALRGCASAAVTIG